jgi:Kdo2-lipid IVA lauroyltransferase/acyltransferase
LHTTPEIVERADAVMLPVWTYRDDNGHYHIRIEDSWPEWTSQDPSRSAALYMRELEKRVRQHPEQYLWMHRRFKTRPKGQTSVY